MNKRNLVVLALSVSLLLGLASLGGCVQSGTDNVGLETQTQIVENIIPQKAFTLIEDNRDNPNFVIIDVRTPEEFAEGYIEGAINLDYYSDTFRDELGELDSNKTYLVYCRSDRRSGEASDLMERIGFRDVYNMLGGIIDWKKDGLPTVK